MTRVGGYRNYGYGKALAYAGKNAIRDRYGDGHYATRAAHAARWRRFAEFARKSGIKDAQEITREVVAEYGQKLGEQVRNGQMAVRYAQNLLSTVNIVLETMRRDRKLRVSPSTLTGRRDDVRREAPVSMDRTRVRHAMSTLERKGEDRVALVAALARDLGLRFREASLLNARRALRQAKSIGRVNITDGTKGGRGKWVDRWVPVRSETLGILTRAAKLQHDGRNLIPKDQTFKTWRDHAYSVWRYHVRPLGISGFHDLRAAYACDRYQQLTREPAPVIAGQRLCTRETDRAARAVIALELGHGRIDVLIAYVGSAA